MTGNYEFCRHGLPYLEGRHYSPPEWEDCENPHELETPVPTDKDIARLGWEAYRRRRDADSPHYTYSIRPRLQLEAEAAEQALRDALATWERR